MYIVVFRTIAECTAKGAITRSNFESKEAFDKWYDERLKTWYEVVKEGISNEHAAELCSSPEAQHAAFTSIAREAREQLERLLPQH